MQINSDEIIKFIRDTFKNPGGIVPLHEPIFDGNEKNYICECIDTTYVSSVGKFVSRFEKMIEDFTGCKYAIAAVNGTAALHIALLLSDVRPEDEVITQALTFIATANAISYSGAKPIFIDVDLNTLGLSPKFLKLFLEENTKIENGNCINKLSGKRIKACIPMHTFGHPCLIDEIIAICNEYNIDVIEDAAESLGSYYKNKHTGTFGKFGTLSFNGNKIITTGGGGMILTDNEELGILAKHLTTTAKVPHPWEFVHDKIGYNYRLTNLAAALGCAQMEQLPEFLIKKRKLSENYFTLFNRLNIDFFHEPENCKSNYWLNTLILRNKLERNYFLEIFNNNKIQVRPVWEPINKLKMYSNCQCGLLENLSWLADRIVNIPSSVIL